MKKLDHLAYNKLEGKEPTIVFFSGFKSDMEGTKALYLESVCKELGHGFVRFDYFGHGKSDGDFKDGTISQWKNDCLQIIDEITSGPLILVGSSMGAWLMLLSAIARPQRVMGLIGIAAAPDFTNDLMWAKFDDVQRWEIMERGFIDIPNCYDDQPSYPITKNLIEDGGANLILGNSTNIDCPIILLHGMQDQDVPYQTSLTLAEKLVSQNVKIHLVKNGDHRMSNPGDLALLKRALIDMINL